MDAGIRSPLLDFFRRGEVARDVRLLAAKGTLAPRAHEQLGLLVLLTDDGDEEVRTSAEATLALIPRDSLSAFLARTDVPDGMRSFFGARGVEPASVASSTDDPLVDGEQAAAPASESKPGGESIGHRLTMMSVADRMKAAMKGTREERSVLIRDPNKLVSVSVLSSPRLTEAEVENFARLTNVSEEILRMIGMNRAWVKNYGVIAALTKNPKTPLSVSLNFVQRLNDRDLKVIAMDRNLQQTLKQAVRKRMTPGKV